MRRLFAALVFSLCLFAQMKMSVADLKKFIRSSIRLQHDDKQVADYLKKVKLTEKLDDLTIEELQGEGAGIKTVNALRDLAEATASLPAAQLEAAKPAPPPPPPPPSPEIQKKVIDEAREYALNYTKNLPNFICLQVTRRYFDQAGLELWSLQDTVATRLSYFEQKEDYKVVSINGRLAEVGYDKLDGATSSGEFGTMLREIFDPATEAKFVWDRWGKLRGKVCHVYAYRVLQSRSKWTISWQRQSTITPGYRGYIYIDRDVPMILRVTLEAIDIPATFQIQMATNMLDYDFVDIAGIPFLLPLRAEVRLREGRLIAKNVSEFRNYRKFGAEATITFETPDALPEDKFKEEKPAKKQ